MMVTGSNGRIMRNIKSLTSWYKNSPFYTLLFINIKYFAVFRQNINLFKKDNLSNPLCCNTIAQHTKIILKIKKVFDKKR